MDYQLLLFNLCDLFVVDDYGVDDDLAKLVLELGVPSISNVHLVKDRGNSLFREGNFILAARHYTQALKLLENGQTFKCVDFHKQPAFRDSSLGLQVVSNLTKLQHQESVSGLGLGSRQCPIGTVPILDRPNHFVTYPEVPQPQSGPPHAKRHCSAKVRTRANPSKKFFGAAGALSIYKPNVPGNQWSSARIRLLNGGNIIEAGWMINPSEFKNNEAHLYASFNVNGKGCINLDCPGFVQVSRDVPLGITPNEYSSREKQIVWDLAIDKDKDGNWWLSITSKRIPIGYWPKSLFSSLKDAANQVEFGGEINNPNAIDPPTPMGNGRKADYDTTLSACFYQATVVDGSRTRVNPPDTEKYTDCSDLYTVLDGGHQDDPKLGRLIFYGGPGPIIESHI
ncbi:protein neprosin-like [Silene latifolia]|uniref:protein neprosin-like n=1 Tax=Silene latifolia TaxID=37657 RepID=UPI003D77C721